MNYKSTAAIPSISITPVNATENNNSEQCSISSSNESLTDEYPVIHEYYSSVDESSFLKSSPDFEQRAHPTQDLRMSAMYRRRAAGRSFSLTASSDNLLKAQQNGVKFQIPRPPSSPRLMQRRSLTPSLSSPSTFRRNSRVISPSSPRISHRTQLLPLPEGFDPQARRKSAPVTLTLPDLNIRENFENNEKATEEVRRRNFQEWLTNKMKQQTKDREIEFKKQHEEEEQRKRMHIKGTKTYEEWCAEVDERLKIQQKKLENDRILTVKNEEESEKIRHKNNPDYQKWLEQKDKILQETLSDSSLSDHEKIKRMQHLQREKPRVSEDAYNKWLLKKEMQQLENEKQLLNEVLHPPPKPPQSPRDKRRYSQGSPTKLRRSSSIGNSSVNS